VPGEVLRSCPGVAELSVHGRVAHLSLAGSADDLLRAAAPYGIEDVTTHEVDLADVFLRYYEDEPCPA
jgi:ABC-2 type transport system ATP-binding protein